MKVLHAMLFATFTAVALGASLSCEHNGVRMQQVSSGAMSKTGYYMPQRIELSPDKPASLKQAPAGLGAPLYGEVTMSGAGDGNGRSFLVIVDEPDDRNARLFIDSNANGDLTDDPPTEWKAKPYEAADGTQYKQYGGGGLVQIGAANHHFPAYLGMYRFDKNDPQRQQLKNVLLYYRDYAYAGKVNLGGKSYDAMLVDEQATADFRGKPPTAGQDRSGVQLLIDVNANGAFDRRGESFDIRQPFNIAGNTYEVANMAANGSSFSIVKSGKAVEHVAPPPDHAVGRKITSFTAAMMNGQTVQFPQDYKGKLVMLDFWATWCTPCMKEVPELVKTYEQYYDKGFEILGISLDSADATEKINQVTENNSMTWPQVYDGKGWKAQIATLYAVQSIPTAYLVDGDNGEILAAGNDLRGDKLKPTIEAAFLKKYGQNAMRSRLPYKYLP